MTSNPMIVMVPGPWHDPSCFSGVRDLLKAQDFSTVSGQMPSVSCAIAKDHNMNGDANYIREKLLTPYLNEGNEIVMVMHSYGGECGGQAVMGLTKAERKREGKKGGIIGLIYMTAFMIPRGRSLTDAMGGILPRWVTLNREIFQTKAAQSPHFFYNDLEPDEAAGWERKLKAQSGVPFIEPVSYAPFEDPAWAGRCAFIYCTKDNAITPDMQARYIANYQVPKNLVVRIEASHSPFLSKPEATASAITELTKRFLAMMVE